MRIELTTDIADQKIVGLIDLKKLADEGNAEASNLLGLWLLSGLNCSPDLKMAFKYFEKAAQAGIAPAMTMLARCYAEGRGVAKDFDMAELWIRAAHECGDKDATEMARVIFMSTIGYHKPDVKQYVDFLVDCKYPNGTDGMNKSELKDALLSHLIFSEVGKSESSSAKITENDIRSYELMNDIYSGDPVLPIKNSVDDAEKADLLDKVMLGIDSLTRNEIAERVKLLYCVCADPKQQKQLKAIGNECNRNFSGDTSLTWFVKAKFGIVPPMVGGIEATLAEKCIALLRKRLDSIEEAELTDEYSSCESNLKKLIAARNQLHQNKQYSEAIKSKWMSKITERIAELQNCELADRFALIENDSKALHDLRTELKANKQQYEESVVEMWINKVSDRIFAFIDEQLTQKFESVQGDYDALYKMLRSLRQDEQEQAVLDKWDALLSEHIVVAQKSKLAELCASLDGKSHQELTALVKLIKEQYSFDNTVSQSYITEINKLIAVIEKQALDDLVANIDGLTSAKYGELIAEIERLRFNPANTKPYIELISNHKNCAVIIETCTEDNLASWELADLEKYLDVISASTLSNEKKSELTNMVNSFVNVFRECRDKKTLQLLQNCEPENIAKHTTDMLRQLRTEVNNHQLLPAEVKAEIIARLDEQMAMRKFEQSFAEAKGNYDAMLGVLTSLSGEGERLPQAYRTQVTEEVRSSLLELQRIELDKLTAGIEKKQHGQIKKTIATAKHFAFDKDILNEAIVALEAALDAVECQTLEEICSCLDTCTVEDVEQLREKIRKLGFKDENIRPFKAKIDAHYGDLVFDDLSKKCTQWDISQLATTEDGVATLLSELQNCGKDEAILEPYIKRVSAFLAVQTQLRADVSALYQKHFNELQAFAVAEMSSLTFPQYSRLNVMCEFKPERVAEKRSRLSRFKVEGLEQMVFIFDDSPGANTFNGGFCITNLAIHCLTDGRMKYIPLESITEIKTGKLFNSISVSGTSDSFKFSVQEDFVIRNALANALQRIVAIATERKRMAANENQNLATAYSAKYDECFANTPIPNDKTFADRAMEIKQEEARKAEEIANSPALSPEELMKAIPELVNKYGLSVKYHVVGTQTFMTKLPKARAAYATYDQSELPLMLEDHTIFGSAKDGFVLTNKAMYIHAGGTNGKVSLERIVSVFDSYDAQLKMHRICMNIKDFNTANGNAYMSYTSDDSTANTLIKFWTEVLELLGRGRAIAEPAVVVATPVSQVNNTAEHTVTEDNMPWLCNCGKTNEGKFCPNCGAKKETGTPMWRCTCGNVNKGKFCPKCGSKKP